MLAVKTGILSFQLCCQARLLAAMTTLIPLGGVLSQQQQGNSHENPDTATVAPARTQRMGKTNKTQ